MNEPPRLSVEKNTKYFSFFISFTFKIPIVPSRFALALIATALLTSCSAVKDSVAKVSKSAKDIKNPFKGLAMMNKNDLLNFKLNDLRTNTPPIVKVRPEDLQEMISGKDRYLAYHQQKELYYIGSAEGTEYLPQDFDPSNLPDGSGLPRLGILPPLSPGVSTAIDVDSDLGELTTPDSHPSHKESD